MKIASVAAFSLAFLGTGCSFYTIRGPLVISTRPVPELGAGTRVKTVTGRSCGRTVLLLPISFATADGAYADALSQAPGTDTLLDYEERVTSFFVLPFYAEVCWETHGKAVASSAAPAAKTSTP